MKLLIVSDIHGNFNNMKKVIQNNSSFDKILILGDVLAGPNMEDYNPLQLAEFLNIYKDKIIAVRGNCDYDIKPLNFSVDKSYLTISIDGKLFLMTHGHMYNRYRLPVEEFDVFLSGHTHIPVMDIEGNKIYLNPGSITIPRGGSGKSYIYYEDGVFYLKDLDKNEIIKKINV